MIKRLIIISLALLALSTLIFISITDDIPFKDLSTRYTNAESSFIEINDLKVHYRDEGSGNPILLLHGTASSLHTWDDWTTELSKTHRIIRMDLPGFGLTGPNQSGDYSIDYYVSFVHSFVKELGIDTLVLAGNSLGGNIAWRYAAEYPQSIQKLILLDPSGFPRNDGTPWIFSLARTPILNKILRNLTPRFMIERNVEQVYFDDSKITESLVDRYYELALREGNRQAFIDRAKLSFEDKTEMLSRIECPTIIIWGSQDEWIPASDGDKFAMKIPQVELVLMDSTGHVPMEEKPIESLSIVLPFLDTIE